MANPIAGKVVKPWLERYYLTSDKTFHFKGLVLKVPVGVFHPGLYFSSKIFAKYLLELDLEKKKLLDVGCGSGLLSLIGAQQGAYVTALDLSERAVQSTIMNARLNQLSVQVFVSDLFDQVKDQFDFIVINPPYYPKKALSPDQFAWYCGPDFEYFEKLFSSLPSVMAEDCRVLMILSDGCDIERIKSIATVNSFQMNKVLQKDLWFETNLIFELIPIP